MGTIKIIDNSEVSLDGLQNQVLYGTRDIKRPKVASAKDRIRNVNKSIVVEAEKEEISADNVLRLIEGYDLVIDCTDNYKSRYLINDACVLNGTPLVFGAVYQFEGRVGVFNLNGGPCYRCLFKEPPPAGLVPSCASGGTISPLPGIIGSIQANEALKLIIGVGEVLSRKLLIIDSLYLKSKIIQVQRQSDCPICGKNPTITDVEEIDYDELCGLKTENEIPVEGFTPDHRGCTRTARTRDFALPERHRDSHRAAGPQAKRTGPEQGYGFHLQAGQTQHSRHQHLARGGLHGAALQP